MCRGHEWQQPLVRFIDDAEKYTLVDMLRIYTRGYAEENTLVDII